MNLVYGNFKDVENVYEYLVISFDPSKRGIQERWKGNSISADFLAAYWGAFGPSHTSSLAKTQMKDTISWVANELIENAVKFSNSECGFPIRIFLQMADNTLNFYVENSISSDAKERFVERIVEMQREDISQLYFKQVEKNASEGGSESRLGLLIMKMDLGAEISWKFQERNLPHSKTATTETVTTMVSLPIVKDAGERTAPNA